MRANLTTSFEFEAHNDDIKTLRSVLQLAVDRLNSCPVEPMIGTPLKQQAGLKGNDLIKVKNMITNLAAELGMGELDLEPKERSSSDTVDAFLYAFQKGYIGALSRHPLRYS